MISDDVLRRVLGQCQDGPLIRLPSAKMEEMILELLDRRAGRKPTDYSRYREEIVKQGKKEEPWDVLQRLFSIVGQKPTRN